jgi:hypothetical protein
VRLGDGDELDIAAAGDGILGPSADPDLLHGAVSYSVVEGRGRVAGASGLITSKSSRSAGWPCCSCPER